jgi:hypothetical protein
LILPIQLWYPARSFKGSGERNNQRLKVKMRPLKLSVSCS